MARIFLHNLKINPRIYKPFPVKPDFRFFSARISFKVFTLKFNSESEKVYLRIYFRSPTD